MELPPAEFIRRFEQHILPKGFTKIRHYGYLSNRERTSRVAAILKLLKLPPPKPIISYDYATAMLIIIINDDNSTNRRQRQTGTCSKRIEK